MTTTDFVLNSLASQLGSAAGFLGSGSPFTGVGLIKAPFTPGLGLLQADVDAIKADFPGYNPLHSGQALQWVGIDSGTGRRFVTLFEPAGGWVWYPSGAVSPTQTIYGYYVSDATFTTLMGTALLPTPIEVIDTLTPVIIPAITFDLSNNYVN